MKKILYLLTVLVMTLQVSCGNFLKDTSGDLIIPKSVNDYAALLYGEGYPKSFPAKTAHITLMTDDVEMGPTMGTMSTEFDVTEGKYGLWAYRWDVDVEEKIVDEAWAMCYEYILGCNTIIQAIPTMTYDAVDADLYNSVAASAYALRAYYYLCLINWYATPYDKNNLSGDGVVIRTSPNVTIEKHQRSTIGEVYNLINSDIAKAKEYSLKGRDMGQKFLISQSAVSFLSNRISLFQENWDDVIEEGERFLRTNKKLFDLKTADKTKFGLDKEGFTMLTLSNPEVIFSYGNSSSYPYLYLTWSPMYGLGFKVNKLGQNALIPTYEDNDLRKTAYYKVDYEDKYGDSIICFHYPLKYRGVTANVGYMVNWRNVEVYLNVAEAYARKESGVSVNAITLLNTIRINRYDDTYKELVPSDFRTKEELIEFIWGERRKELAFEETMRFWDIRRQGCKSIRHDYYENLDAVSTYILPEKSRNFTLQIPRSEYNLNNDLKVNERDVIIAK